MNKEKVSGKAEELKGKVKEKLGFITSDPDTEAEGVKDQIKGKVKQAHGEAKEKFHKKNSP
ncbi:MAG TPA: CsbD family protein [Edaphobacter sp.]|nr:CsbD family protein [Edaphobacter sp.]